MRSAEAAPGTAGVGSTWGPGAPDEGAGETVPVRARLRHEAPAVVLLLDVSAGLVVRASTDVPWLPKASRALPLPAADWVRATGLVRAGDGGYPVGTDPVSRAAAGEQVDGEQVWVDGPDAPRAMWATGFPLPDTVEGPAQALLVLVDVERLGGEAAAVRDRAVVAAGLAFTIADPRLPDAPLVFVNPAFERTTGYSWEDVRGRNCRFLQGPDTDPAAVQEIRDAIVAREHAVVTLLNHRKDGTPFWNELSLSPVYDGAGELTHYVGIQADVTLRVEAERARERHLAAETEARTAAQDAERRLRLLVDSTTAMSATLDVDVALRRLAETAVPRFADWCLVELVATEDEPRRVVGVHVDPARQAVLDGIGRLHRSRTGSSPVAQVEQTGRPLLIGTVGDGLVSDLSGDDALRDAYRALGYRSGLVVPMVARGQVLGVLSLVQADSGRRYTETDLDTAADVGRRAALAVDNARLYSREHAVAEQLQRSLLPTLPEVGGLDRAARYLPGSSTAAVGGDWYDLFPLPDGAIGLAIGDVMGHDLQAAAAMGQLRSVLRSYAWTGAGPATVLDTLDQLVQGLQMAQLATAVYGRLDLPDGKAPGRLVLANAGHLPPVLRRPDGRTELLDGVASLLVGADLGPPRDELVVEVASGSVLVLCTDGLVERRGLDPDEGLERLRAAVEVCDVASAEAVCQQLLDGLASDGLDDDVALLVVRVL